ncbi:MAG: dihydrofolate reductase family protein [SAR324 cluster bacterium]|nr:dihydrofolate reductase family protein [SAR324 cluster bacterium]
MMDNESEKNPAGRDSHAMDDTAPAPDARRLRDKLARSDRPYVTLKAAVTLDGKIATRSGASRWITGEAAREFAHRLRANHDAVLVGINTVTTDDPQLTVRLPDQKATPARAVLDSLCKIDPSARFMAADGARRFVISGAQAPETRVAALREAGADVLVCDQPRPEPACFLPYLRQSGIDTLLVEGGGQVHANLIAHGEADELWLLIAGKVIGGGDAPGWCGSLGVERIEDVPRLALLPVRQAGEDIVIRGMFGSRKP